jgi:hypothetical protein
MLVFSLGTAGTVLTALRFWKSVRVWQLNRRLDRTAFWQVEIALLVMLSYIEVCTIGACANLPTLTGWWRMKRQRAEATAGTRLPATAAALTAGASSRPLPRHSSALGASGATACSTTAARAWSVVTSGCGGGGAKGNGSRHVVEQGDGISVACSIRMESMSATAAAQSDDDEVRRQRRLGVRKRNWGDARDADAKAASADIAVDDDRDDEDTEWYDGRRDEEGGVL